MSRNESCFLNTLHLIDTLQKNSNHEEECDTSCQRPFLSNINRPIYINTRPITFYRCDNSQISIDFLDDFGNLNTSNIFRIENIDGNCITCRILTPITRIERESNEEYEATTQTAVINLGCVCAIKCLPDTFVCL
jgi:Spore coat protein Z.